MTYCWWWYWRDGLFRLVVWSGCRRDLLYLTCVWWLFRGFVWHHRLLQHLL